MGDLPVWVFLLDFLFKNPRRGFSSLFYPRHTQFPLWNFLNMFQRGFSSLLLSTYTHVVGFSA